MIKTNRHSRGVIAITGLAAGLNNQIGGYVEHYINEGFGYTVRVTTGGIRIPETMAADYEAQPTSISQQQIQAVANSFWKV